MVSSWPWPTMTCCWRPMPVSESSSWMSSSRQGDVVEAYSDSPVRNRVRVMVTSLNSIGSSRGGVVDGERHLGPAERAARSGVPAKMTSSILAAATVRGPWAPSTQATASTRFDLPEPLGPTTTVTPGSNSSVVLSANDLKPFRVSDFRNTADPSPARIVAMRSRRDGLPPSAWSGWRDQRTRKPVRPVGASSAASTWVTAARRGPCRHHASTAATASGCLRGRLRRSRRTGW